MKKMTAILALLAVVGFASACGETEKDNTPLLAALALAGGSSLVGTWAAPVSGSSTLGACIATLGAAGSCSTNYPEGACALVGGQGYDVLFSTSTGATSTTPGDNLCASNGYTANCSVIAGSLICTK